MKKILKVLILLSLVDILVGFYYFICLIMPKVSFYKNNDITIYDQNNEVIIQAHGKNIGSYLPLNEMGDYIPMCFIASEDINFYNHYGYDIKGIIRAFYNTLFKNKTQGGSTITQQLARTLYLSNEKTLARKIKEAILTARIETNYTKNQILEQYLNSIYLGHDIYGVEVAAKYYFNKECKNLSLDEAALIAGIANAPSINAPDINYENAIKRRNYVLKNLYIYKKINKGQYNSAMNAQTKIKITSQGLSSYFNFYFNEIVRQLKKMNFYNKKNIANGLNIYTSIDLQISKILYKSIDKYKPKTETQSAIIILQPYTNKILAMSGSFDSSDEFNRATMSIRPIGSTIKPMIYYLALDYGLTPISKFISEPTTFHIQDFGDYSPKNSNDKYANRKITMIEALSASDNIYATKTLLFLGSNNLINFLSMFNINYNNQVPSISLGVSEMTLLDLANIYNTFASEGTYYKSNLIHKITDKKGNLLYSSKKSGKKILNKTTTLILNQLLTSVFDKNAIGYSSPTLLNYKPIYNYAAKTGSTYSDSYVIGFNPNFTIAVWVGKDDNSYLYETQLSKQLFVELANNLNQETNNWYTTNMFVESKKINPITGLNDNSGSFYWFKI